MIDPDVAADEIARLGLEAARISSRNGGGSVGSAAGRMSRALYGEGTRPEYNHAALTAGGIEDMDAVAAMTPEVIEDAAAELAELTGYGYAEIMEAARLGATGRSAEELAVSLAGMSSALLGPPFPGYDSMIALADSDPEAEIARLSAEHSDIIGLAFTAEQRDRYEKSGVAMPGGDFPIPDAKHLAVAKAFYAQGKLAGHPRSAVAAHINKRAKALGLPGLDDDGDSDGDTDVDVAAASAGRRRLVQAGSGYQTVAALSGGDELDDDGYDPGGYDDERYYREVGDAMADLEAASASEVSRLTAQHSEYFGLAARHSQRDGAGKYRPRQGKTHLHDEDDDAADHAQPARGGDVHSEVARYLAMHEKEFGGEGTRKDPNRSHRPKSRAQRDAEQRRARPGHTNGGGWADGHISGPGGHQPPAGTLMPG